jgi:phosphoribosyl 1,2-cyclic phosphodiesterase
MKLKCLGSSSNGNCYIFEASDGILILEAGIPFSEIKKGLGFKLNGIVGAVITHQHNDHAASMKNLADCGVRIYTSQHVLESKGLTGHHFCHAIEPMHGYRIGGFKVFAFPVNHDVPCLGFVIEHAEMGKTLFITDTMMLEYRFPGLDHIMIEANYADRVLDYNIENGYVPEAMRERLLGSHMELETTKGILAANDLSKTREIILIHLSGDNSNKEMFKDEVERATGLPIYIADKGLEIDLTL